MSDGNNMKESEPRLPRCGYENTLFCDVTLHDPSLKTSRPVAGFGPHRRAKHTNHLLTWNL